MTIVVVGDPMLDKRTWLRPDRPSPETGAPIGEIEKEDTWPGGALAVWEMVRALGETVEFVHSDPFAYQSYYYHDQAETVKHRVVLDGKELCRMDKNRRETDSEQQSEAIICWIKNSKPSLVLLADYGRGVITPFLWHELLDLNIPLIVDPSRHRRLEWYRGAHAIVPNRVEARVSSVSEAASLCRILGDIFPHVCIKLDRDGMVAYDGKAEHIPSVIEKPIDVCGAGDMVLAAVGVGLVRGMSWLEACRFANEMAGRKCMQRGATGVTSSLPQVAARSL